MDDDEADEIAATNGVPRWLARLEPLWAYFILALAFALVCVAVAVVAWTVALLVS